MREHTSAGTPDSGVVLLCVERRVASDVIKRKEKSPNRWEWRHPLKSNQEL